MAAATPQSVHRDALLAANRAVIDRIRNSVSGVTPDALTRRPPNGGWSIAEVLEHLILSADSYLAPLGRLIQDNAGAPADASAMWKPSFMGGLLTQSLRNPRKLPTSKSYKPGPSPRSQVLEEFIQRQETVGRLIAQAGGMDWQHVSMRSPVMPLLRMNLGDALTILVVHAERHAGQIERVKEKTLGARMR
jgi:DinB superfamily